MAVTTRRWKTTVIDEALKMTTWSTRSLLGSGCDYAYVSDHLTAKLYREHLIDVATVNGLNSSSVNSLRHSQDAGKDHRLHQGTPPKLPLLVG